MTSDSHPYFLHRSAEFIHRMTPHKILKSDSFHMRIPLVFHVNIEIGLPIRAIILVESETPQLTEIFPRVAFPHNTYKFR